jgi:phosphatidylserine decarboxylase
MAQESHAIDVKQQAGWLPGPEALDEWVAQHVDRATEHADEPLHPTIQAFQRLIDSDSIVRMCVEGMLTEGPSAETYRRRHIERPEQLLRSLNALMTFAPEFSTTSMLTTPFGAVFEAAMGTAAGFEAFRHPLINDALRDILNAWCEFLNGPDSLYVLHPGENGWTSDAARETVGIDQYRYDPDDEHWGFRSWNDFFTRRFKEESRPVAAPDDPAVIVSAVEATPYKISTNVRLRDTFWAKYEPYSLADLLADEEGARPFVGGTVHQAYLSAMNYHRWHSPVAGTIVRADVVHGTYFSEAESQGSGATEPSNSQGYLAHVATRAVIVLEADEPAIGRVAVVQIGMSDVSSCVIAEHVRPGAHLDKGDELGYFQFGGSTACLLFEPDVVREFAITALPQPGDPEAPLQHVLAPLATADLSRRRS